MPKVTVKPFNALSGVVEDLPTGNMSNALEAARLEELARQQRAIDLGFTQDAFKGDSISREILNNPEASYAGFFSNKPEVANRFAEGYTSTYDEPAAQVYPVKLKMKNPLVIDAEGDYAANFQFGNKRKDFLKGFEGDYDGVILKNTKDEGDVYIPKGSEQIRSKFAQFDPAKKDESGLLLGKATPTLTPVDYDPFDTSKSVDPLNTFKAEAPKSTIKLAGEALFGDFFKGLKPADFNPSLIPNPNSDGTLTTGLKEFGRSFLEGAKKSGAAGLESMATALENQYKPEGAVSSTDAGEWLDKEGKVLPSQYRPNVLPLTRKPDGGVELAMPAMLDVWNTLGGAGGKNVLGAGPSLRPALKYMDKIYKAKPGEQHLDALPENLRDTFQKQALSGEDITNFNFGFMNHKGQFLTREDALKYAIDNGILDPHDAKFGTLVTTMLNQSGGEGKLVSQSGNAAKERKLVPVEGNPFKDAATKARAIEQGYDTDNIFYHGSPTFKEQVGASFDLNHKPRTDTGYLGQGVYFTPQKWIAEVYAKPMKGSGSAGDVIEAIVKKGNYKDFVYDENYVKTLEDFARSLGVTDKFNTKDWSKNFSNALKKEGYDGARGMNTDGSIAEIAVFDPAHVRSTKAAFDPKNVGKSGILLSDTGTEGKIISQTGNFAKDKAPPFYSALENAVGGLNQAKASGEQWLGTLANQKGVKPDELEWTGIKEFLAGKKNVSKQEIQDYLKNNKVELGEVWKGTRETRLEQWKVIRPDGHVDSTWTSADGAAKQAEKIGGSVKEQHETKPMNNTKYEKWQLPGGSNYRELLLTLPEKKIDPVEFGKQWYDNWVKRGGDTDWEKLPQSERNKWIKAADEQANGMGKHPDNYLSSHWDEPNILAHIRMNDRTIDGKKSLHLEELQSDLHQAGRDRGYKLSDAEKNRLKELSKRKNNLNEQEQSEASELAKRLVNDGAVPNFPFKKNWHELALKRAIREAAENGYERLSWTPGEAQAARYDLSKQINNVRYKKNDNGTYKLSAEDKNGKGHLIGETLSEKELVDNVGKEVAEKIIKGDGKKENLGGNSYSQPADHWNKLEGLDLKIGGEGMKGFYDQIIPKNISKLGKEYNLKVEKGKTNKGDEIFYIDIPAKMRQNVIEKGFPLFSGPSPVLIPINYNPFENEK